MARSQKKKQTKTTLTYNPRKGLNMSALANALNSIGAQITRKQKKALEDKLLRQTSRRSGRASRPVPRWVPALVNKTKKVHKKKSSNNHKMNINNTKKSRPAPYKASQLKHVAHLNHYKNVAAFYNANQKTQHSRFGPNTRINNIRQAMSQPQTQPDTSSFATPETANLGIAQENIEKMKTRKVSAIPFIMSAYLKNKDHKKAELFKKKAELLEKISQLYENKKATYGFTPNTTLYEVYTKLRSAEPQNTDVDELAELFGATRV